MLLRKKSSNKFSADGAQLYLHQNYIFVGIQLLEIINFNRAETMSFL